MRVIIIKNVEDLEKINKLHEGLNVILIRNNINLENINFKPIDAEDSDVIIYGFNKTIYNLNIDNKENMYTGLFSKVRNIYVRNITITNVNIKGGSCIGILAGYVENKTEMVDALVRGKLEGLSHIGGVVGVTKNIITKKSFVKPTIKAKDVVGSITAMAETAVIETTKVDATHEVEGKIQGSRIGYLSSNEEERIIKLIEETSTLKLKNNQS